MASAGVPVPEMVAQRRAGQEPPFHPGYTAVVVEVVGEEPRGTTADEAAETEGSKAKP